MMSIPLKRIFVLAAASLIPLTPYAAEEQEPDLQVGKLLHRQCALCHGQYSQGILGGKYPRLAGLPEYYLNNATVDYRDGIREHAAMTVVGGLRSLSDHQLESLSAYISDIDLNEVQPLDVPTPEGADVEEGEDLYKADCKTCHGRKGEGKKKKDSPPLRGQYPEYLLRQIEMYKNKEREHADDPEDETFVDYSDQEILDIIGFATTFDDAE